MLIIEQLRCEFKKNPMGIDVHKPRFSWQIKSDQKNVKQTAYHIQVAECTFSAPAFADAVWDSGEVKSAQSVHVQYAGPALSPRTRYAYRLRINISAGDVPEGDKSDWSEAAFFETGFMTEPWQATWISPGELSKDEAIPCDIMSTAFH